MTDEISADHVWRRTKGWLAEGSNHVTLLEPPPGEARLCIDQMCLSDATTLGSIALHVGGLLVDHGWLRLLGAGCARMRGSLANWNGLGEAALHAGLYGAFLVGHDVVGGFFALDGGAFGGALADVWYLAPDSLAWEPMQFGYPKLLHWACSGDLGAFYASLRWDGWQGEVETLSPDDGLHLYPPPWTAEGKDVGNVSRRPVPMDELWSWVNDARRQLG